MERRSARGAVFVCRDGGRKGTLSRWRVTTLADASRQLDAATTTPVGSRFLPRRCCRRRKHPASQHAPKSCASFSHGGARLRKNAREMSGEHRRRRGFFCTRACRLLLSIWECHHGRSPAPEHTDRLPRRIIQDQAMRRSLPARPRKPPRQRRPRSPQARPLP
jgi:hypothetical protein